MVNDLIKDCRIKHGYTQDSLALYLNVSRQTISNWENGKYRPDPETSKKLSVLFGLPSVAFYDDSYDPNNSNSTVVSDERMDSVVDRLQEIQLVLEKYSEQLEKAKRTNKHLIIALIFVILFFMVLIAAIMFFVNYRDPNTPDYPPYMITYDTLLESEYVVEESVT